MSINGFNVNGSVHKYNFKALDNLPVGREDISPSVLSDYSYSLKDWAVDHYSLGHIFRNTWVNGQGVEEYSSGWSSTDYIQIKDGHSVVCIYTTVATSWVLFFNSAKQYLDRLPASAGITYLTIPTGSKYFRVSNTNAGIDSLVVYDDDKVHSTINTSYLDTSRLVPNVWLNATGVEETYSGWSATAFIEIPEAYSKIIVYSSSRLTWNFFYDSEKVKISDFSTSGTNIIDVPSGAKYVRFSGETSTISTLKVYGDAAIIDKLLSESIIKSNTGYPMYYNDHLDSRIKMINQKIASSTQVDSFVFITDIHYPDNTMHSPKLIEDVCRRTGITSVQLNGDFINKESEKDNAFIQINRICGLYQYPGVDTYITVGNHEYNNPGSSNTPEALALQLSQDELRWPILHRNRKKITIDPNSLSYYYDNEDAKIRYFVGTVGRGSSETTESHAFIARELENVPSGYGVVVIYHTILRLANSAAAVNTSAEPLISILDAAKNKTTVEINGVTYNYTGKNFDMICALCGDYHLDMVYTTAAGVKIIATTCDAYGQQWTIQDDLAQRPTGTYEEQAFDVITIDRIAKKVYLTRIGYGSNREYSYS